MPNDLNLGIFRGRTLESHLSKSVAGALATHVLTVDDALHAILELTGAITANKTIVLPAIDGLRWGIANNTTGAFSVSVQAQGGTLSVTVPQGIFQEVWCNGTDLYALSTSGAQSSSSSTPAPIIGSATQPSTLVVNNPSLTTAIVLTSAQASALFIDIHNANNGLVTMQFPAMQGRYWIVRNAADSLFAVRTFAAGTPGTFVDVNPGYDAFIVVDDSLTMTQIYVKHGNTHAAAGIDPITLPIASSATPKGVTIELFSSFTPSGTGADTLEVPIPYDPNDGTTPLTYNVRRATLVAPASGTLGPTVNVEKSTVAGAFVPATIATVSIGNNLYQGAVNPSSQTVASGNRIRANVTTLGNMSNLTLTVELGWP